MITSVIFNRTLCRSESMYRKYTKDIKETSVRKRPLRMKGFKAFFSFVKLCGRKLKKDVLYAQLLPRADS